MSEEEEEATYKCLCWNVHGAGRFAELGEFVEKQDVIVLQETWLTKEKAIHTANRLSNKFKYWIKGAKKKNNEKKRGRLAGGKLLK